MTMPNFGYHLARAEGAAIRRAYSAALAAIARRPVRVTRAVSFPVFSYSSEESLPEQVASIRSFLQNAGRPPSFTVVSDGTHSQTSMDLLRSIDRSISVAGIPQPPVNNFSAAVQSYLRTHPTGRQLALVMSLPREQPCLYADSDVLFFPGAREIESLVSDSTAPASYLADCRLSADQRLFRDAAEQMKPVNTGVLFLRRELDWSGSISRLSELKGAATFFTNQTLTHLAMHANRAQPLDPTKFVLQLDDQFVFSDRYARDEIVLRHYVNPVRHKFWTSLLR